MSVQSQAIAETPARLLVVIREHKQRKQWQEIAGLGGSLPGGTHETD
jgi:hypothetical protein